MLEERIVQLERECRTKSELLAVAQEDLHQYSTDLTRMEKTMDAKDSVIKYAHVSFIMQSFYILSLKMRS